MQWCLKQRNKTTLNFYFSSYISLGGVFHVHFWISNNRTVTIICMYECILFFVLHVAQQNLQSN